MHPQRLADELADPLARVQRRVGVLEDHLHLPPQRPHLAPGEAGDLLAVEADRAGGRLDQLQDGPAERRLAAARLPDQAERFAAATLKLTPSTACTGSTRARPAARAVTGKCLTRSVTSSRASPPACGCRRLVHAGASRPIRPSTSRSTRLRSGSSQQRSRWSVASATRLEAGHLRAALEGVGAARAEGAAAVEVEQRGRRAGDLRQPLAAAAGRSAVSEPEQAPGVGVLGVVEDLVERSLLDDPPRVHHQHPVGDLGDDAEVVGDEDRRQAALAVEPLEQGQDLRLDGDVERRRRLVGDQHLGLERQRHRDHRPLAHAAGEFVRVGVDPLLGVGDPDRVEHLDGELARLRACRSSRGGRGSPRRSGRRPGRPG